jgi:hypothetical protein
MMGVFEPLPTHGIQTKPNRLPQDVFREIVVVISKRSRENLWFIDKTTSSLLEEGKR